MTDPLIRAVIADDERPARAFLADLLARHADIAIVGEAETGGDAVRAIEALRPDVAFLDLQMPELDGIGVVRLVKRRFLPLVVFVTAYEEYALRAFELNAVDYLLKPVSAERLAESLERTRERLDRSEGRAAEAARLKAAAAAYEQAAGAPLLERIPVRRGDEITLLLVRHVASVVAERELLHITSVRGEKHTITYRLKDLEARLDPERFVRLGRGALAAVELISKVHLMPGGGYIVRLSNGQELQVSRIQSRVLRERLLRL
jgi:two-component system, LytTR family, response regulator